MIGELSESSAPFFCLNTFMDILKLILAYVIAALSWIVGGVAFIVRILAYGLLEIHLFLEWCMFQLVKAVETIYPDE